MVKSYLKNHIKKYVALLTAFSVAISLIFYSSSRVIAFDDEYANKEGMALGYAVINGYSKMYYRNVGDPNGKAVVYSGLEITPYVITMCGMYILSHGIDVDKFLSDNDYAMQNIENLNSYFSKIGIKSKRAEKFKQSIKDKNIKFAYSYDNVGIYIFDCNEDMAYSLIDDNEYVDFVLVGGKVPDNMKDLNFDGITDKKDAKLIQHYLAGDLELVDNDEKEYAQYASDINKDKSIDINDVTEILLKAE
ncbi:MAG: hypothetical protein MJ089_08175 [Ruminococcus sp.]|nr:hypothetical protein [Ruminococcus sp.]